MEKTVIFAAFGADKALLEEFLAFQAHQLRQQDEHDSDVSEAAPGTFSCFTTIF
ncbi:hypothetical protein FS749_013575 [Ceratobasidium sp. UAMH 11750]|nr:hypothetical protein FS749_013575 [Ceratobasidium sp. UAMH 11750]